MAVHKCAHRQRPHFGRSGRRQPYRRAYGRTQIVPYGRSRADHHALELDRIRQWHQRWDVLERPDTD